MTHPHADIILLCALKTEARPLLRHLDLHHVQNEGNVIIYGARDLLLAVTGVGYQAAATAASQLNATCLPGTVFLNIGIAGAANRPIGTPLLAHEIIDGESGRRHYPAFPFRPPCDTSTLVTVVEPVEIYASECTYDMEASAYFDSLDRSCELVHSLKIVSDGSSAEGKALTAARIEELVADSLYVIEEMLSELRKLTRRPRSIGATDPLAIKLQKHCHFTATESEQLFELLRQLGTLDPGGLPASDSLLAEAGGKGSTVLGLLRSRVAATSLRLT